MSSPSLGALLRGPAASALGGCWLLTAAACTAESSPGLKPEAAATHWLQSLVDTGRTPGVQYAFMDAERVLFTLQAGRADLQRQAPVTRKTTFNIYSVTKTFTALAVLSLAARGQVDLDAALSRYVPELRHGSRPTVRETLSHTAGFPNPIPISWVHLASRQASFDEHAFTQRVLREHHVLVSEPGEKFAYSNVGYLALGELIHRVTSTSYEQFVAREIVAPLALADDEVISFSIPDEPAHARGYMRRLSALNLVLGWFIDRGAFLDGTYEGWTQFRHLMVDGAPYGGLIANAAGLSRYAQALLRAQSPFTAEIVQQLFTPARTRGAEVAPVGLAWFTGTLDGEPYFTHAGGGPGYYCELRVYPTLRRASVVLFNRTGTTRENILDRIDGFFLKQTVR